MFRTTPKPLQNTIKPETREMILYSLIKSLTQHVHLPRPLEGPLLWQGGDRIAPRVLHLHVLRLDLLERRLDDVLREHVPERALITFHQSQYLVFYYLSAHSTKRLGEVLQNLT